MRQVLTMRHLQSQTPCFTEFFRYQIAHLLISPIVSKTAEYGSKLKQKDQEMQESMERQKEERINTNITPTCHDPIRHSLPLKAKPYFLIFSGAKPSAASFVSYSFSSI